MDDSRHLEPPGPGDASDLAGLAGQANELWQWAGSPTEEALGSRLGTRHTGRGFVTEKLPSGTLWRILAGEAVGWVVIEPFIVACLRCGRRAEDQINMYLGIWRPVWTAAEQAADADDGITVFRGEPVTGQTPAVEPQPHTPPTGATPAQAPSGPAPTYPTAVPPAAGAPTPQGPPAGAAAPPPTPPLPPTSSSHPTAAQPAVAPPNPPGATPTPTGPPTGATPTAPVPTGHPTPPAPQPPTRPSLETDATQPIQRPALGQPPLRQGPGPAFPQGPPPAPPPEHGLSIFPTEPPEPPLPPPPGAWSSPEPPPQRRSRRSPALLAVALSMVAVVAVVVTVAVVRHKSDSDGHGTAASDSRTLDPSQLAGNDNQLTESAPPSGTTQASASTTPTATPSASATPTATTTVGSSSAPGTTAGAPPPAATTAAPGGGSSSSSAATSAAPPPAKTSTAPAPPKTTTAPPPPSVCTPSGCAGRSYFVALGEHLFVCDQKADGYAAVAEYTRTDVPNQNNVAWNKSGNGSCIDHNMNMPEGAKITFRVCLGDSAGKLFNCSGRITTTS